MNKPLAPQFKAGVIKRMHGKTEKPEALKYAEADAKILEKMKADTLKYGTAPPWFNEVDPKKPLALQVKAFNKRQAAKERARKLQQEQDGIKNDWADSADSSWHLLKDAWTQEQRKRQKEKTAITLRQSFVSRTGCT